MPIGQRPTSGGPSGPPIPPRTLTGEFANLNQNELALSLDAGSVDMWEHYNAPFVAGPTNLAVHCKATEARRLRVVIQDTTTVLANLGGTNNFPTSDAGPYDLVWRGPGVFDQSIPPTRDLYFLIGVRNSGALTAPFDVWVMAGIYVARPA